VVLTLIGGGVFGNPIPLIWESILWAVDELEVISAAPLEVVVNARQLPRSMSRFEVQRAAQRRGGSYIELAPDAVVIHE
jgi:hypothetical protein